MEDRKGAMEKLGMIDASFWENKKVLVTGHTGFKGSWLVIWLHMLGAKVIGYGLDPITEDDNYVVTGIGKSIVDIRADIRNGKSLKEVMQLHQPEFVFHLAAQPLVLSSYEDPVTTYETNVMGTLHVLEGIKTCGSVRAGIMVTSDKCYENKEMLWGYHETDAMGGYDPYSSSKGCAELLISSYRNSYFNERNYAAHHTAIASVRAGNVIGGGDWSPNRLVPDCIRSFLNNEMIEIRNPQAIRPWQHVIEPLSGYLTLAAKLYVDGPQYAEGWNFGPDDGNAKEVEWIVQYLSNKWGDTQPYEVVSNTAAHEAKYLKLDCSKAKHVLNWHPKWDLSTSLDKIIEWTHDFMKGNNMLEICRKQIQEYMELKTEAAHE